MGGRGSSGARGGGSSPFQAQINALQPLQGDEFKNPIPYVGDEDAGRISRMFGDLDADETGKLKMVDASKVSTVQEFIYKGPLENPKPSKNPITAVEYKGKIVVVDGNHRTLLSRWKGEKIQMRVYKL